MERFNAMEPKMSLTRKLNMLVEKVEALEKEIEELKSEKKPTSKKTAKGDE